MAGAVGAVVLAYASGLPACAAGAEAEPFAITAFTAQTTEASTIDKTLNEPYFFDQAGGHPSALTSTVRFGSGDPKNVIIYLPPGLVANPQAVPHCSGLIERCPPDTQVGVFVLHFSGGEDQLSILGPIVNMTPYPGVPSVLGLEVPLLGRVLLTGRLVHTTRGYTLAIVGAGLPILNLSNFLGGDGFPALHLSSLETTLWGVPAAAAHNPQRGLSCFGGAGVGTDCLDEGGLSSGVEAVPFLTMPGTCSGEAPTSIVSADSWENPAQYAQAKSALPQMAHCERSSFSPEVSVRPETTHPEAPDGINVTIKVPQFDRTIAAAPELREATVTLPQGMAINPGVAESLRGCNPTGPAGINIPTGLNSSGEPLKPGEAGPGEALPPKGLGPEEPLLAPGDCPNASIVGTAEATTPLLARPIEGRVYIATPGCGGPGQATCTDQDALDGNLYRLYVELGGLPDTERNQGVLLKLLARVQANPATGQLTVRLDENPQLPLSELSLHLFGGERGLVANPSTCGPATTTSDLEPWSAPGTPNAAPSSSYNIEGCVDPQPFDPGFLAGSLNSTAGAFSPFTVTVTRKDGEQDLSELQVHAPPGLSAMLASVPLCPESLASKGECSTASQVGSSEVAAGSGTRPLYMPGDVYLTGPYDRSPFGLAIVTDALAGPLDLGRLLIRARISIDPQTAALTITSDPLPQIVLGIPLRLKRISLTLDRPHFIINPTSCETKQIATTVASTRSTTAGVSNRYALADCKSLTFKPKIAASTAARTSLSTGASLDVRVAFPKVEQGTQANLARIKVDLPAHLPSRLTTLQGACPETTFKLDAAACPSTSIVGIVTAQTPLLSSRLTGPVYFVTHGHNVFPSPILVLQGDGVRFNLVGSTAIDKAGITSVTFNAIPDIPLDSLELYLPRGSHSLLSANTSLCALRRTILVKHKISEQAHGRAVRRRTVTVRKNEPASLAMPSELVAHNGAIVRQAAKVEVTGCGAGSNKRKTPRSKLRSSAVD